MYSFHPLADVPADHTGFWIICCLCAIPLIMNVFDGSEEFFVHFFICTVIVGISYGFSYHVCRQETIIYKNEKVVAEFAGYAPEGYREKSGKAHVDRHFVYVIYKVNGDPILLRAEAGVVYPARAILYKN